MKKWWLDPKTGCMYPEEYGDGTPGDWVESEEAIAEIDRYKKAAELAIEAAKYFKRMHDITFHDTKKSDEVKQQLQQAKELMKDD